MPVKNIIPGQHVTAQKQQRAKELRRNMTPAEKILWNELRANKLGVHFRRQQVIQGFIVDFYCHKAALVVEVDGDIHDLQKEEDDPLRPSDTSPKSDKFIFSDSGSASMSDLGEAGWGRNDEVVRGLSAVVGKIKSVLVYSATR